MGKKFSVKKVLTIKPPITAMARDWWIFAPIPIPKEIGRRANNDVKVVKRIGLALIDVACLIASSLSSPFSRSLLIKSIKTIPLFTDTPSSVISPMKKEIFIGCLVISNAIKAPMKENGISNIIAKG